MAQSSFNINGMSLSKRISWVEFFALSMFSLYAMLTVLNSSLLPQTYPFLSNIKYAMLGLQLFFLLHIVIDLLKTDVRKIILYIAILCVAGISYINSGLSFVLITTILIIYVRNYDFDNILLFLIIGQMIGILLVVLSAGTGIVENINTSRLGVERYALGFLNANTLSNYLFSIILKIMFLRRNLNNALPLFISNIIFLLVILITDSRTSFLLLILFDLLFCVFIFFRSKGWLDSYLSLMNKMNILMINGLFILSYLSAILFSYSNPFMVELNEIFSYRISSSSKFFYTYGFSLLGQEVELVSTFQAAKFNSSALILDNGYLQMLIIYGVVFSVIFYLLVLTSLKNIRVNKEYLLSIVILIYIIYGFNSGLFLSWEYNFILFYGLNKNNQLRNEKI